MTRTIAIIPARGGSKRIPRKNMQRIGGTSLVGWSVRACVAAGLETYVSTDDGEIGIEAQKYGAKVVARSHDLRGDHVTSEAVMREVLGCVEHDPSDVALMVQCTSPFTTAQELRDAATAAPALVNRTVFATTRERVYVWHKLDDIGWRSNGADRPRDGVYAGKPPVIESGAFYARTVADWLEHPTRFTHCNPVPLQVSCSVDIDTLEDLEHARMLYRLRPELQRLNRPVLPIKCVVFDVDGVLTDGCVPMRFSRRDGAAIARMRARGIRVEWVTNEEPVDAFDHKALHYDAFSRSGEMRTKNPNDPTPLCRSQCHHVPSDLRADWICANTDPDTTCYVADSNTDADALAAVGCGIAPSDAMPEALAAARYIVGPGGRHVAEQVEELLSALVAG